VRRGFHFLEVIDEASGVFGLEGDAPGELALDVRIVDFQRALVAYEIHLCGRE